MRWCNHRWPDKNLQLRVFTALLTLRTKSTLFPILRDVYPVPDLSAVIEEALCEVNYY